MTNPDIPPWVVEAFESHKALFGPGEFPKGLADCCAGALLVRSGAFPGNSPGKGRCQNTEKGLEEFSGRIGGDVLSKPYRFG